MTTGGERVANLDESQGPINKKIRVFKLYFLKNIRPQGSLLEDIPDLQMTFCETHAIMRVSENIVKAALPSIFNQRMAATLNEALLKAGVK